MFRRISWCSTLALLLIALQGCIPSKSETGKAKPAPESATPASAPAPAATAAAEESPQTAPAALVESPAPVPVPAPKDGSGQVAISLGELSQRAAEAPKPGEDPSEDLKRMEEMAFNQGGAMLYLREDGKGFDVKGAYGFTGTLLPNELGTHWILEGEFVQTTEGLQVGEPAASGVVDGIPGASGGMIAGMRMVTIPVVPPDINAVETGDTYRTPVKFTIEGEPDATFVISFMAVQSL